MQVSVLEGWQRCLDVYMEAFRAGLQPLSHKSLLWLADVRRACAVLAACACRVFQT